jgi:hypothetical protein
MMIPASQERQEKADPWGPTPLPKGDQDSRLAEDFLFELHASSIDG